MRYQTVVLRKPIKAANPSDETVAAMTEDSLERLSNLPDFMMLAEEGWELEGVQPSGTQLRLVGG